MEYIARSTVMNEVPTVLVAYLDTLTALASGPKGAQVRLDCLLQFLCIRKPLICHTVECRET
jgi:hypothetical protein